MKAPGIAALALALAACGSDAPAQSSDGAGRDSLVVTDDPELRALAEEILPDLARRSGLELREPVRIERRSREELVRYLRAKLDEDLGPGEAERITRAYSLLGLVSPDTDLRGLLVDVYTEQVAGFYDPDSTALFVMEDESAEGLASVLVHELVHAVQDQAADLDALTGPSRGNDRQVAAQAAIEGHATLVMLEYMMERARGSPVDLSEIPNFADQLRPALEATREQYPALAAAPRVFQEGLLFPYLSGAGFVQALWSSLEGRPAPFGEHLPLSTEQVQDPGRFIGDRDDPTEVTVTLEEGEGAESDGLGQLETRILLEELVGRSAAGAADGWDGDRWVLVGEGADAGLVWVSVWDDVASRDRFVAIMGPGLRRLPRRATLSSDEVDGRPVAVLRVGRVPSFEVSLSDAADAGGGR